MKTKEQIQDFITKLNGQIQSESLKWEAGYTSLLELDEEEINTMLCGCSIKYDSEKLAELKKTAIQYNENLQIPPSFDWRNNNGNNYVTPIKDQKQCGSCVAFASIATIEANLRIKNHCPVNRSNIMPKLSEANAYYCNGGDCNGMSMTQIFENIKNNGVVTQSDMPYFTVTKGNKIDCYENCKNNIGTSKCRIKLSSSEKKNHETKLDSYHSIYGIDTFKQAIYQYGPILASTSATASFLAYKNGVWEPLSNDPVLGNHAICFVGYNDAENCFIVKNSWGTDWGDNGFCKLSYTNTSIDNIAFIPGSYSKIYISDDNPYDDVYLRRNFSDFGQSKVSGTLTASPDIIPNMHKTINDHKQYLEEKWFLDISQNIYEGPNYIYMRGQYAGSNKTNYKMHLYYCKSSLLMYPNQWKHNKLLTPTAKDFIKGETFQYGDICVPDEPFFWNPEKLEANEHYCLIGRVETDKHPNYIPDIEKIDDFAKFIATTPGYAWRNVSIVPNNAVDHYEVLYYEQGANGGKTYFLIDIDDKSPIGAACTLSCGAAELTFSCEGNLSNVGTAIGTLTDVPANFKGNILFTYKKDGYTGDENWSIKIRALFVPQNNELEIWESPAYSHALIKAPVVYENAETAIEPKRAVLVGEYIISGVKQ